MGVKVHKVEGINQACKALMHIDRKATLVEDLLKKMTGEEVNRAVDNLDDPNMVSFVVHNITEADLRDKLIRNPEFDMTVCRK